MMNIEIKNTSISLWNEISFIIEHYTVKLSFFAGKSTKNAKCIICIDDKIENNKIDVLNYLNISWKQKSNSAI